MGIKVIDRNAIVGFIDYGTIDGEKNSGRTAKDEDGLYELCEKLNKNNIRFGMSNVFENKGIVNQKLIDWCKKNNWNIYTFDNFTYTTCEKGNAKTKEVFIYNY